MGIRERFAEWLLAGQVRSTKEKALIVPNYKVAIGEYQVENIRSAIDAYLHDEDIFNAVNFISNAALSQGFYVTGDEQYKNGKAIDLVKDFNRSIRWGNRRGEKGLAELLRIVTKELLYGGNTFIEMLTPNNLQMLNQIELSSIFKMYRNETGDIKNIQQLIGGKFNDLNPDSIIHIPWLQIDREAFGRGLIQPLIAPRLDLKGRQIPPFYRIKASLEYDLYRMIHRKGIPRSVFSFPEAGDELIESYAEALRDPDVDVSFTTNTKVDVAVEQGGPAQGIESIITYMDNRFQSGLQTPINNLLNSSGYTEASARVAEELGGLIVKDLQMRLQHVIEVEIYERIIIQAGLDPIKANIVVHWGSKQEPDYTLTDVGNMFDRRLITVSETRKIMRKLGWELEDDSSLSSAMPTATTSKSQQIAIPIGNSPNQPGGVGSTAAPQAGLIQAPLNPLTQANAQSLAPSQTGQEIPENPAALKAGQRKSGGKSS
ncbi:MAG: hypothetical protein ACYC9R_12915 [Nitrosotalea sp.]